MGLTHFILEQLSPAGTTTHEVQQDPGSEKFLAPAFSFNCFNRGLFSWKQLNVFPKPGFGLSDVPEAPFARFSDVFV